MFKEIKKEKKTKNYFFTQNNPTQDVGEYLGKIITIKDVTYVTG